MAGEIKLNSVNFASESGGTVTLSNVNSATNRTNLGLGTAATSNTGDFEAAGSVSTHAALTTAHGISAFGATLVDDANAAAARTTLGLGSPTSVVGQVGGGTCVQVQSKLYNAQDSTTSTIPFDDTIPQNNEGKEFFSVKITPSNSSNVLLFQATVFLSSDSTGQIQTLALFVNSEANAKAVSSDSQSDGTHMTMIPIMFSMTAGTTSEITFKIRGGNHSAGTLYVNGNGSNVYSTAATSTLTVSEFLAIS
jgi:hypothetical protein